MFKVQGISSSPSAKELEARATEFLRSHGCRSDGRERGTAPGASQDAMNIAIRCPFGGYSRTRKGRAA